MHRWRDIPSGGRHAISARGERLPGACCSVLAKAAVRGSSPPGRAFQALSVTPCLASTDGLILKVTFIQHCRKYLIVPAESEICFPLPTVLGLSFGI